MTSATKEAVMPVDSEYFTDVFDKYSFASTDIGKLPLVNLDGAEVSFGGLCIIHLWPSGRRYMWVVPKANVVDLLGPRLRHKKNSNVFFDVVMRKNDDTGKVRALVRAIQGCDSGAPHAIAVVRSDSIPEPET